MRVLWVTNSPFPEVFEYYKAKVPVTVGWVHSAACSLLENFKDVHLAVASYYNVEKLERKTIDSTTHYLLPKKNRKSAHNDSSGASVWQEIINECNPDVIHIHGSEYPHSFQFVQACGVDKVVVSIQGLVSVYERYYFGGISKSELLQSTTIRDVLRFDTLFSQHKNMRKRGEFEKLLLKKVNHIIGRTGWDRAHSWAINPDAEYHFCNETLRSSFYKNTWALASCEKHSIFISQAQYPIKGFHQLLKALPVVLKHYPDLKVYVAGHNFFSNRGIRIHGFGKYINSIIKKYGLSKHIHFLGLLSEEQMCKRFIQSHVFVCPSAIENSPNSVGEAQILGVPCISSYVGGIEDMIAHNETGLLYRFEETEMLAENICRVFSDDVFSTRLSINEKNAANKRHDKEANAAQLHEIYTKIKNS